jgi:hypothetical protein
MKFRKPTLRGTALTGAMLALSLALVPAALAGKGKPGGGGGNSGGTGGTIALVMVNDANGNGSPNYGDTVTFAVSTTATSMPWVTLDCYQSGTLVLHASNGIFPISLNQNFVLGETVAWQGGGAANCTATLQNWDSYTKHHTVTNLASMSFNVGA